MSGGDLTDGVTGLPKPVALETHLALALLRARSSGAGVAVIVADVRDYSGLIAEHGWAAGDRVLAEVAERFRSCLRDDDMVARMFGDIFAGVCEDIDDPATVSAIVDRLRTALRRPYAVDGHQVHVTVDVGTAMAQPGDRPDAAIRRAEPRAGRA
jgi:diguanylate cyclase (GGDEF)-like protein